MSKADIWMPLYIGDYLSDTMHLTTEQHGAYLLLIMHYWKSGKPLPSCPQKLATICKLSPDAWSIAQADLKQFFDTETDPSLWIHGRIKDEMEKAGEKKEKASDKARKAAEARYGKGKNKEQNDAQSSASSSASSNQQALLGSCPSQSQSEIEEETPKPPLPETREYPEWLNKKLWGEFRAWRSEIGKGLSIIEETAALHQLQIFKDSGQDVDAVIRQSIISRWPGLFEVKGGKSPPATKQATEVVVRGKDGKEFKFHGANA